MVRVFFFFKHYFVFSWLTVVLSKKPWDMTYKSLSSVRQRNGSVVLNKEMMNSVRRSERHRMQLFRSYVLIV